MKRPLLLAGCAFIAAAFGCFYLGFLPTLSLAALLAAGGLLFCKGGRRAVAAAAAFALFAILSFQWRMRGDVLPVAALVGERCAVRLTVTAVKGEGDYSYGEGVADLITEAGERFDRVGVRFHCYHGGALLPGESYAFEGAVGAVGVHTGTVRAHMAEGRYVGLTLPARARQLDLPAHPVDAALARLRTRVGGAAETLGGDAGAFLRALLTGDRQNLSQAAYDGLRVSGLAHMVAVSGLHITFAANLTAGLLGGRRRGLGYLAGVASAFGYAALAGFSHSALRAALMFALFALAQVLGRRSDGLTSLALAGVVILAVNPLAVGSLSFQLSFLATLGILTLSPRLQSALGDMATARLGGVGWLRAAIESVSLSAGALVFTTPLTAARFGFLPTYAVLANLLAVSLMPMLLLLTAVGTVGCLLSPALWVLLLPARWLATLLLGFAAGVGRMPFAALRITERFQVFLVLCGAMFVAVAVVAKLDRRHMSCALCLGVLVTCGAHMVHAGMARGEVELITFETLDAAVFRRGDAAVVLGLPDTAYAAGQVADALNWLGVTEVAFVLAEGPQALRLLGERIPIDLAGADLTRPPVGVARVVPTGDGSLAAMGLDFAFEGGAVSVYSGEKLLIRSPSGYAIIEDKFGGLHTGAADVHRAPLS